jgi:ABC-type antimicrobial peptide transport system permease subunit
MHVIVRTRTAPASITAAVRNAIREIDPHLPLARVAALETFVDEALAQPRFSVLLVGGFGIVSLLLACVGLYGAVSYSVASRTRELGVRVALGASPRRVFGHVLGQCVRISALGIAIGLGIALLALRVMEGFLYGIEPTDPATFAALSALLLAVAMLAGYVPARRAMRVDPLVAMRVE